MKAIKAISVAVLFLGLILSLSSQQYNKLAEVISSGGGETYGSNYSNFGVLGEVLVNGSVSGGNYVNSTGFIYASDIGPFIPSGYTEIKEFDGMKIYPNPASELIFLEFGTIAPDKIEIYDIWGEIILETLFNETINISKLSSGLFFIKAIDKYGTILYSEKFIKE